MKYSDRQLKSLSNDISFLYLNGKGYRNKNFVKIEYSGVFLWGCHEKCDETYHYENLTKLSEWKKCQKFSRFLKSE